jgi:DNA-3-methyladenine glycosylase I
MVSKLNSLRSYFFLRALSRQIHTKQAPTYQQSLINQLESIEVLFLQRFICPLHYIYPSDFFMSYCDYVQKGGKDSVHKAYHDMEYGFPIDDDNLLFARLVLEINQAGLSWETILKKKDNFFRAFDDFKIDKVARYSEKRKEKLMQDAGIIRNRLKIEAAVHNANVIRQLQKEHGSFRNWLDSQHPKSKEEWVKLFKKQFRFTGGEIVNEFLMSTGYLPGAHSETCPVYKKVLRLKPKWLNKT